MLAFHEGFADVVAILQHFTHPAVLSEHIGTTHDVSACLLNPPVDLATDRFANADDQTLSPTCGGISTLVIYFLYRVLYFLYRVVPS